MSRRAKLWFVTVLTFVRFPLVLLFVAGALAYVRDRRTWIFTLAFSSLVASAVTDLLDGYFARRLRVETRLGEHADPLMDKLFYLATLPLMVFLVTHNGHTLHGLFLLCITVFFLARDQWVTFLRSIGSAYNADARATWAGKVRTCINFPLICAVYFFEEAPFRLIGPGLLHTAEAAACVMNVVSLWTYTRRYWPYLHRSARHRGRDEPEPPPPASPSAPPQPNDRRDSLVTMARGAAHDYNNLLAAILGNTGVVLRGLPPTSPLLKPAQQAEAITLRAIELTNRLQTFTGRPRISAQPLDLSWLVRDMTADVRACAPAGVEVEMRLAESLPPVAADVALLREAILNVVRNAADALAEPRGAIVVTTGADSADTPDARDRWVDAPPAGRYVFVEVADTGCGIADAVLGRLFDPFFSTKMRGQGLGLSVALGIVRAHGGAFRVRTRLGEGSEFRIALPSAPATEGGPTTRHGLCPAL
jgi:CDP-diacylglycerol--glycerol-3-phosphate 3-phosphatidyltransferase